MEGHGVFNFALDSLNPHKLNKKLSVVFKELNCAAKLNVPFSFVLKNVEDGSCWYFYAHENNNFLERSTLVAAEKDLVKVKIVLNNTDLIESCTRD